MLQSDGDAQYRKYAGEVLWPTTPDVLTDTTRCPACLTPLTDIVCRNCGLDLAHPAATRLAALSKTAADALSGRIDVIGRIRHETSRPVFPAETATGAPIVAGLSVEPATLPPVAPASLAVPMAVAAPSAPAPSRATPDAPHPGPTTRGDGPRRSSVQVALLVAGVCLLSLFAIFFLVYAFINYGIIWRSVIIAAITVAAFASASVLRRRRLTASAEGLAVFALVLVYLDAYALRANDFFGLASTDEALYWGATITLASMLFIAWHRMSAVRAASIVGWVSLAFGVGILTSGILDDVEPGTRVFATLAATAAVALTHTLIPHGAFAGTLERMLVLGTAALSLSAAFLVSWLVDPFSDWGGTLACAVVAVVAGAHVAVATIGLAPTAATRVFGVIFATIGGVAAASAVAVAAVRIGQRDLGFAILVPVVCAAAVTLVLELAARRGSGALRRPTAFAAWGSGTVLALIAVLPLATAARPVGVGIAGGLVQPWSTGADVSLAGGDADSGLAVLALATVVALAAATWAAAGDLRLRGPALAWGASVVLLLAAAQLAGVWATLAAWLVLAAIALGLLLRLRDTASAFAYRACLGGVLATSTVLLYIAGWGSLDTWAATTTATVVLLLACRRLVAAPGTRATLLGAAVILVLHGVGAASQHLTWGETVPPATHVANAATLVGLTATVLLALAAFACRRAITTVDRRTVFWIAGAAAGAFAILTFTVATTTIGQDHSGLLVPPFSGSLGSSILLFAALALWVGVRATATLRPERIVASVALAPTVYWVVDSFARVLGLTAFAQSVVPITAALLAAAGALALTLLRPSSAPRWARELGVTLVAVPAVAIAVADDAASGWLVLVFAAVTVLLMAISPDGLFGSRSARRQLGWLALALATAGLWWRLSSERVEALEPYVLPLAAALLLVSALIHRAATSTDARSTSGVAPLVALAGLLVGVLPLAANSITGDVTRPLILFSASAALLLVGSLIVGGSTVSGSPLGGSTVNGSTVSGSTVGRSTVIRSTVQPYLDAAALAGAVGVLVTAVGRALQSDGDTLAADGWMVALVVVLATAASGQAAPRVGGGAPWRDRASQGLAAVGILALLGIEANGFSDAELGTVRVIATVGLLCALHVIAYTIDRAPLTRAISLVAIAGAGGAVTVGLATDALEFVELGTVPIAIALIVTGRMRLAADPAARSWRTLGLGVAVLLLPSLLATVGAPELWRLVGLGVVAVGVLIVGAVRRLQAPFLLGLVVALVHGFATFAPQIRAVYESQEWWLWAGLAGVVLVLLAIRYEKRIQNLRAVVLRIATLR